VPSTIAEGYSSAEKVNKVADIGCGMLTKFDSPYASSCSNVENALWIFDGC
jgi:hypothetical protein